AYVSASEDPGEKWLMMIENNKDEGAVDRSSARSTRFYVRARSVNAVRRALYRAPGGARVASRLEKAGLVIVARHEFGAGENPVDQDSSRDSSRPELEDVDH